MEDKNLVHKMMGTVPGTLPQTAPAAEACAYNVWRQLLVGQAVAFADCLTVVSNHHKLGKQQLSSKSYLAGFFKHARGFETDRFVGDVAKVKAHQDTETIACPD